MATGTSVNGNLGPGAVLRIGAFLFFTMAAAQAALPIGVDCDMVRLNYQSWRWMGMPTIRAWLKIKGGFTADQVAEAERCLSPPKPRR